MKTPHIVTSSWSTKLPKEYAPIGISRGTPRGRGGYRRYRALEPGAWFRTASVEEFISRYNSEILDVLDPECVVADLQELAGGRVPALLCWEPPEPGPRWCHRSLVSVWMREKLGMEVFELGLEHEGCGHSHPKLHPDLRHHEERACPVEK